MFKNPLIRRALSLIVVWIALAFVLAMTQSQTYQRSAYANEATRNIYQAWGEKQLISGVMLKISYDSPRWIEPTDESPGRLTHTKKVAVLVPTESDTSIELSTSRRSIGLFSAPVYEASVDSNLSFDPAAITRVLKSPYDNYPIQHVEASLSVYVKNAMQIVGSPSLQMESQDLPVLANSDITSVSGFHVPLDAAQLASLNTVALRFNARGSESIQYIPVANRATLSISGDWPHPSFLAGLSPGFRDVQDSGFDAKWQFTDINNPAITSIGRCLDGRLCEKVFSRDNAVGVDINEPVNLYRLNGRASDYANLFVILVLASIVAFEVIGGRPVHTIQYFLAGASVSIFFLLQLALSEHFGFFWAYVVAATACVSVLTIFMSGVLGSTRAAIKLGAVVGGVYGVLLQILYMEDFAFLSAALVMFFGLAFVMVKTRKLDWYQLEQSLEVPLKKKLMARKQTENQPSEDGTN
ncbi:MAG: inner membrane CreD family protein [Gammaproteobacteria bacterium]|nr:inner membrane CreD family protein [Gammaproteobacteria bacterium]